MVWALLSLYVWGRRLCWGCCDDLILGLWKIRRTSSHLFSSRALVQVGLLSALPAELCDGGQRKKI